MIWVPKNQIRNEQLINIATVLSVLKQKFLIPNKKTSFVVTHVIFLGFNDWLKSLLNCDSSKQLLSLLEG